LATIRSKLAVSWAILRLSAYVIDELNNAIVNANEGKITVVDRQQLNLIMQEMQFQTSGLVSDESAQAIGRILGAQYIVSGSMEPVAGFYHARDEGPETPGNQRFQLLCG
jgi:curli biogenesis system outer membrane secretion channel CsgG